MNFQQLRSVREAVRRGFNLTEVAQALHTSQPGVSRQIRELEDELGVEIFVRVGKRLTGLTQPGVAVLPWVERLLQDAESLQRASEEFTQGTSGVLTIAATHSQARYALPTAVRDFRAAHPNVQLQLHQGSPEQIAQMLLTGTVDIGIASHLLAERPELVALPCYRWTHSIVVPEGHPLVADGDVTLERLAKYPIITYDIGLTGRWSIDAAFKRAGLRPEIVHHRDGRRHHQDLRRPGPGRGHPRVDRHGRGPAGPAARRRCAPPVLDQHHQRRRAARRAAARLRVRFHPDLRLAPDARSGGGRAGGAQRHRAGAAIAAG